MAWRRPILLGVLFCTITAFAVNPFSCFSPQQHSRQLPAAVCLVQPQHGWLRHAPYFAPNFLLHLLKTSLYSTNTSGCIAHSVVVSQPWKGVPWKDHPPFCQAFVAYRPMVPTMVTVTNLFS